MPDDAMHFSRWPDATLYEPWDDATRSDMARLHSYLNMRLARGAFEPDGSFQIPFQDLSTLNGVRNVTHAKRRLLSLPDRSGVSMTFRLAQHGRNEVIILSWPKFVTYQKQSLKDAKTGKRIATRARAAFPFHPDSNPSPHQEGVIGNVDAAINSKANGNGTPLRINPVDIRTLPIVERFVDALHREEARRKLPATRVSQLVTERLRALATRIGDYDLEAWERRAVNAVERRVRSSADDCSVAWTGPVDETVALRLDQLASSPGWTKTEDPYAYKGPNTTWGANDA